MSIFCHLGVKPSFFVGCSLMRLALGKIEEMKNYVY